MVVPLFSNGLVYAPVKDFAYNEYSEWINECIEVLGRMETPPKMDEACGHVGRASFCIGFTVRGMLKEKNRP